MVMRRKNSALEQGLAITKYVVLFGGLGVAAYGGYYAYQEFKKLIGEGPGGKDKAPPDYQNWDGKKKAEYWFGKWVSGAKNIFGTVVPGGSASIKLVDSILHTKPSLTQSPDETRTTIQQMNELVSADRVRQWTADERSFADFLLVPFNWNTFVENYPGLNSWDNAPLIGARFQQIAKYGDWWNADEGRMHLNT